MKNYTLKDYQLVHQYDEERSHVASSIGSSDVKDFKSAKELILTIVNGHDSASEIDPNTDTYVDIKDEGDYYFPVDSDGDAYEESSYTWYKTEDWVK
jgi:hypothetical protein